MTKSKTKMTCFSDIFNRSDNRYTKKSLLYQDILSFPLSNRVTTELDSFTSWEIAKWLIDKNLEFLNKYNDNRSHTTHSNRIEHVQRRIKRNMQHLIDLKLLRETGTRKQERGTGTTYVFQFTIYGLITSTLIKTTNPREREKTMNRMYELLQSLLAINEESPVTVQFHHRFIEKCRQGNVFDKLVDHMFMLANSGKKLIEINELFKLAMELGFDDREDRKNFLRLWNETLQELDSHDGELLLFQMKIEAEQRYRSTISSYSETMRKYGSNTGVIMRLES